MILRFFTDTFFMNCLNLDSHDYVINLIRCIYNKPSAIRMKHLNPLAQKKTRNPEGMERENAGKTLDREMNYGILIHI